MQQTQIELLREDRRLAERADAVIVIRELLVQECKKGMATYFMPNVLPPEKAESIERLANALAVLT